MENAFAQQSVWFWIFFKIIKAGWGVSRHYAIGLLRDSVRKEGKRDGGKSINVNCVFGGE